MEGSIDVLDHIVDIRVMFVDKLINLAELLLKRPVSQLLYFSSLDLVDCQQLFVVLFVGLEEAGLADQPGGEVAFGVDADIEDVLAFVALDEALGSHRPLDLVDILRQLLRRVRLLWLCLFRLFGQFRQGD